MRPKYLLYLVVVFALGWSGYWLIGAWSLKSDTAAWLEARRADGWQAEWSEISLRGFPNRHDMTISAPVLADAEGGWAWSAPRLELLRLSYRPDHVIVVWPETQSLHTTRQKLAIGGAQMRGSVVFQPGTARALDRSNFVFDAVQVVSDAGWRLGVTQARLATRSTEGTLGSYDIGIEATGLVPPARWLAQMAEADLLPGDIERVNADINATFDRPWDRRAIEDTRPQLTAMKIRNISAEWGKLKMRVAGDLAFSQSGTADGDLLIKATNWREIVALGRASGSLPTGLVDLLEDALELISSLAGSQKTLDIPLTFSGGRSWIGPVPVGPAPVVRLR